MKRKHFISLVFSFVIFFLSEVFVCGFIFSSCSSSVNTSKDDQDNERQVLKLVEINDRLERIKKSSESKPVKDTPGQTTTTETKPTPTPEPKRVETYADVPSFSRIAPGSRFKFTGKDKVNKEQGYTSSNYYTSYSYYDFGNFGNDGFYNDSSKVAENFVNLLVTKYPFKLYTHFVNDRTGSDGTIYPVPFYEETWCLDYCGSKNIKKHWDYDRELNEIYGHIFVIRKDKISSNSGLSREYMISISDGLTYEDNEKNPEASAPTSDSRGSSSFDSNSSSSYEYYPPPEPIYNEPIEYPDYNDYATRQIIVIPHYGGISPDSKGGTYLIDP